MTLPRWPDVNQVVRGLIAELVGIDNVGPETPADLAGRHVFVRARRVDGGNDDINDYPVVDVDVFAVRYDVGEPLAEQVRQRLTQRRSSPLLDRIDCSTGPRELPWGDGTVRRFGATYEVVARRRSA